MTGNDLYQAYGQDSMIGETPLRLVIALYKGAIDSARQALECFRTGDIFGRSRMISKAVSILTELMFSLDHEKGGEISANLKRLYSYMQVRLLEAHGQKNPKPIVEVEDLLTDLLEAWQKISEESSQRELAPVEKTITMASPAFLEGATPLLYDGYFRECPDNAMGEVFSF